MAPLVTVCAHWSLFEFSQQIKDTTQWWMMMKVHDKLLPMQKYLMLMLCFVLILYIIWTYTKYLLFAVLDKTEIIIDESNIFYGSSEIFRKMSRSYITSLYSTLLYMLGHRSRVLWSPKSWVGMGGVEGCNRLYMVLWCCLYLYRLFWNMNMGISNQSQAVAHGRVVRAVGFQESKKCLFSAVGLEKPLVILVRLIYCPTKHQI